MKRRSNGAWIMAAVAGLAAMIAGEEARAGGISIPIATTQQTGDPTYEYIFTVDLLAGSTLIPGGFFTVYDLPGIPSGALTSQPNISWGSSIQLTGITPTGASPTDSLIIENVTWKWNGASSITAPTNSDLFLGLFIVGSTVELPSPPTPTLIYVGSLDGVNASNQGTVTVSAVPEPGSIILLSTALVSGVFGSARGRRRRPAAVPAA